MDAVKTYGFFALAALAGVAGLALTLMGNPYAIIGWLLAAVLAAAGFAMRSGQAGTVAGATVALGANAYLIWLKVDTVNAPKVCSVSDLINCEGIFDSPFAQVAGGSTFETPITVLGAGFFAGLVIAAIAFAAANATFFRISAAFAALNVLGSLVLGSVLVAEGHFCPFCITIYLANLVILGAAFKGLAESKASLVADLGAAFSSPALWTIAGVLGAVLVGSHMFGIAGNAADSDPLIDINQGRTVDLSKYYVPAANPIDLDGSEPSKGAKEPAYVVVEFADYLCGHCAAASQTLSTWMPLQDDVQLVFKVFPLGSECNPSLPEDMSRPQSCLAALYAECAGQQGMFWEVNFDLFYNQGSLTQQGYNVNKLDSLLQSRGVNTDLVKTCIEDSDVQRGVVMDALSGSKAGIEGTPTFYVKGVTDDGTWVQTKQGVDDLIKLIPAHRRQTALAAEAAAATPPATNP